MSGKAVAQRYECMVEGCDWTYTKAFPEVNENTLAGVFGPGVMVAVARVQHMHEIEDQLKAHFESHPILDWVKTVASLQATIAGLKLSSTVAGLKSNC